MLLGTLGSDVVVLVQILAILLPTQLPVSAPGKAAKDDPNTLAPLRTPPHTGESQMEFLVLDFNRAQTWLVQPFGE